MDDTRCRAVNCKCTSWLAGRKTAQWETCANCHHTVQVHRVVNYRTKR